MIIHNMLINNVPQVDSLQVVNISLRHYASFLKDSTKSLPDFVHILLDFIICSSGETLEIYKQLEPDNQRTFLYYVHDHVENDSNE